MKPKFNIEDYKDKYVMHCDTKEKANAFCKYLYSVGRKWTSDCSYLEKMNGLIMKKILVIILIMELFVITISIAKIIQFQSLTILIGQKKKRRLI